MKQLLVFLSLSLFAIFTCCTNNDEPDYPVMMQPSSVTTADINGWNQTFEYDDHGRVVNWSLKSNDPDDASVYAAHYSYANGDIIHIASEEIGGNDKRCYEENIQLVNGRASKSEGQFIFYNDGNAELRKTYRLEYEYDTSNHLTIVKHSEVVGIGDDIKDDAWNKPWAWENYLIWEDGNLKEFQDFNGNSSVYRATKYEYSIYAVEYPIVTPVVINSAHHSPLVMQGVFGLNSVNLVESSCAIDNNGNISLSRQYAYEFEQGRIVEYSETNSFNAAVSNPIIYKVNWTGR